MGTQYVYDFPELFRQAIQNGWAKASKNHPAMAAQAPKVGECITFTELVLDDKDNLDQVNREPGTNSCGMVGWIFTARTPEYPKGRRFIVVANDITYKIGSFGPKEDYFFNKCTELARKLGIPRIYLSANSGARLGLAEELMPAFQGRVEGSRQAGLRLRVPVSRRGHEEALREVGHYRGDLRGRREATQDRNRGRRRGWPRRRVPEGIRPHCRRHQPGVQGHLHRHAGDLPLRR